MGRRYYAGVVPRWKSRVGFNPCVSAGLYEWTKVANIMQGEAVEQEAVRRVRTGVVVRDVNLPIRPPGNAKSTPLPPRTPRVFRTRSRE